MKNDDKTIVREFNMPEGSIFKKLAYIMSFVGAGSVLMSAVMGPGTLASVATAGADFGYSLLWIIVLSGIMSGFVAYVGGKVAAVKKVNVFEFISQEISPIFAKVLLAIVLATWYMVIFSQGVAMLDLVKYISGLDGIAALIIFALIVILAGYVFTKGKNNTIKLASAMVTITAVLYLVNLIYVKPDVSSVASGLVPSLPTTASAMVIAAIIGGSSPGTSALWYSFSVKDSRFTSPKNLKYIAWDQIYFTLTFTIFSIGAYLSAAEVLHPAGVEVSSALDAAKSLQPIAGSFAKWVFSVGFFGALFTTIGGMSTIGSYGITSLLNLGESLDDKKVKNIVWLGIFVVLLGGLSAGAAMKILVNFIGLLNLGGFVIILTLTYYTSSKKHFGEYRNKWYTTLMCIVITSFNFYSVITYIRRFLG